MSWQVIRPQLKTLLEGTGLFQEISATPKIKFDGYPAAYVVQSDNDADYDNTRENIRMYAFVIRIFYGAKDIDISTALERLETVVDSVIDAIDQDSGKSSTARVVGVSMPSKYTWLNTLAAPSVFGEVEGEQLVMAELKVRVKVLFDIS